MQATHRNADEGAFVLVFVAIAITVLLGLAGFSIDLGNWYLHIDRAQAAADAAALAGAVHLPDEPEEAIDAAKRSLAANRVPQSNIDAATIRPVSSGSGDLYVRIGTDVRNVFMPLVGFSLESHFRVMSTARWQPGLGIGDYSNVLGSEPEDASRPFGDQWGSAERRTNQGQFWLATGGGVAEKQNGDRFGASGCNSGASGCAGGKNLEFKADPDGIHTAGYEYMITAEKGQPGTAVQVQVYDPATTPAGPACEGLAELYAASGNNPRYAAGANPFCLGEGGGQASTYFQLFDANGAPVPACPSERTFAPMADSSAAALADPAFVATFHEWVPLCSAPYDTVKGSSYILRVRSDVAGFGENSYSLRAGLFNGPTGVVTAGTYLPEATDAAVRVYAKKDLPVWANFEGANTQFAIASIPPSYAGQDVTLSLFDLGDASAAGTLSVISSSTSATAASTTADCDYTPPGTTGSEPLPDCTLTNISNVTGFQGQLFEITWHVPADYDCDVSGATPTSTCYMFLNLAYPPGTMVGDRTTWSVGGKSQPLRLIPTPQEQEPIS